MKYFVNSSYRQYQCVCNYYQSNHTMSIIQIFELVSILTKWNKTQNWLFRFCTVRYKFIDHTPWMDSQHRGTEKIKRCWRKEKNNQKNNHWQAITLVSLISLIRINVSLGLLKINVLLFMQIARFANISTSWKRVINSHILANTLPQKMYF